MQDQTSPNQQVTPSPELKSFKPYTGKVPVLLQIIGGLLWLSAAGLIVIALLALVSNIFMSILFLVAAVLVIMLARSLFAMKKVALRNTYILVALLVIYTFSGLFYGKVVDYSNLVTPAILLVIVLIYKDKFVN